MPLDANDRSKLVDALLECDCLKTVNSRNTIVLDLPVAVQGRLNLSGTTREQVNEIARVCSQFPDGINTLLQRVQFFEGESFAWMRLNQVGNEVLAEIGNSEAAAPPPVAATPVALKPQTQPKPPIQVFFSYSHKDEALPDELSKHLSILKRIGVIDEWHDRQISLGEEWKEALDDRINQAQVILLLISSDFMASDYCHEIEMKRALERHDQREAIVIPIILRPYDWKGALFGKLQGLPKEAKPVTTWPNPDEAFTNIAEAIRKTIERLRERN